MGDGVQLYRSPVYGHGQAARLLAGPVDLRLPPPAAPEPAITPKRVTAPDDVVAGLLMPDSVAAQIVDVVTSGRRPFQVEGRVREIAKAANLPAGMVAELAGRARRYAAQVDGRARPQPRGSVLAMGLRKSADADAELLEKAGAKKDRAKAHEIGR